MPEPYRAALAALEERLNSRLQDELIRLTTQFTQTVENVFARMMSTISPLQNVVAHMASQPKASPYTILQWNCRGIRKKKPNSLFGLPKTQSLILYCCKKRTSRHSPCAVTASSSSPPRYARQQTLPPPGFSHVFVKWSIPATQVPTSHLNTVTREIRTVIVQLGSQPLSVSSVYWKPAPGDTDASWLAQIPNLTPHLCVIGGDFNTPHRAWSCAHDSARGSSTLQAAERVHLSLLNSPDRPTRYPLHAAQSATTPDLTWLSQKLTGTWNVLADARAATISLSEYNSRH
ncbi:hypothetical protein HPB49_007457 [Dermacentor silvarum]|uniref:Uncharacterized protein n=1 Tax=Dermacentor silvarum TaxID=543639 RepID=A0ACB8C856_DERSI|nr:hypothetical protein HPB49_007457 [Dermacentor silvarum]